MNLVHLILTWLALQLGLVGSAPQAPAAEEATATIVLQACDATTGAQTAQSDEVEGKGTDAPHPPTRNSDGDGIFNGI